MSLVMGEEVSKSYGENLIIRKASFQINQGEKIGFIGDNGAGKSTLLKIISGEIKPDGGKIERSKGLRIGYLSQEVDLDSKKSIYEEAEEVFRELLAIEKRMHQLAGMMGEDSKNLKQIIEEYGKLEEEFESKGGYDYQARLKMVLSGFGFREGDLERSVEGLSGGERARLCYAKLLLSEPDLLLLDEPTNHLDLEAIEWLEEYLASYKGAVVVVSHDRYFLDRVAEKIWELEGGILRCYQGNYTRYLEQREQHILQQAKIYKLQREEIRRQEDFIRRNIAGQNSRQAQSRKKMLEKMRKVEKPIREREIVVDFSSELRGGNKVLEVSNLSKSFPTKPLFKNVSFSLQRGDRLGVIGPNGTGKTTLLRIIMGKERADNGRVRIGKGIRLGYYDQYLAQLNPQSTVLEEVRSASPQMKDEELRTFLGKLLFTKEEVFSPIGNLSGGEQARVLLAKLMLKKVNFLILDEPTNHLDIKSRKVLEEALLRYDGTILLVSHDRYFLDKVVQAILYLGRDGEAKLYPGNYSYFLEKRRKEAGSVKREEKKDSGQGEKTKKKSVKETSSLSALEEIELQIESFERKMEEIVAKLKDDATYRNIDEVNRLSEEYEEVAKKLDLLYEEWERRF